MYYVYVLKSLLFGKYYKGQTNNLDRRLGEHFSGKNQTTKILLPLKLIFVELCETREEAIQMEKYVKSGFGREIIKEIDLKTNIF